MLILMPPRHQTPKEMFVLTVLILGLHNCENICKNSVKILRLCPYPLVILLFASETMCSAGALVNHSYQDPTNTAAPGEPHS